MPDSFFGDDYVPPTDPKEAFLHLQQLLLEAGAQICDEIPAKENQP